MEDPVRPVIIGIRTAHYTNHRQVLTVSSSNGVQNAKPTNREGDHTRSDPFGTSVAIGCVASVELVAAADQVELRLGYQMVQKGQVEVARNREDIPDANLNKPPSQVAAQRAA